MTNQVKAKVLQSRLRFYVTGAVTFILLAVAAFDFPRVLPFKFNEYSTAAELSIDKYWNWGLAATVHTYYGPVTLSNLGTLETNGILIPEELAARYEIQLQTDKLPIKLTPEQVVSIKEFERVERYLSKTRCLDRIESRYCRLTLFSSTVANPNPAKFVGVRLSENTYGLVESELLRQATGMVF